MRRVYFLILTVVLFGCSGEKPEPQSSAPRIPSGPPRHWDIGDQTLKHQLPEDISDGYLQFARTSSMSYGMTLAHERISARSHEKADMLIYIHSGTARFHVDDKDLTASMGDLIFVPRGSVYSAESLSKRQLQFVTMYAPPLDSADVVYHEAAERVKSMAPRALPRNMLDTTVTLKPPDDESLFENMSGSEPIEDDAEGK